jgi:signal transduction histidine kinase
LLETTMTGGNAASSRNDAKLTELRYLTAAVGHHVINAFSAIVSNAELIRAGGGDAPGPSELESMGTAIVDTALDAAQVARRLIDWARRSTTVESDPLGKEPRAVDINQLIREQVDSQKSSIPSQVEWILELGAIPRFPGDPSVVGAMLHCLLQNAREALEKGSGTITVSSFIDSRDWLVVAIRDSGAGMTPEVLKRATEPFFSTKEDHGGVGLTIAQAIWRRHRGALAIESQPGQGTTIRLSIGPVTAPQPVQFELPSSRPPQPE